MPTPSTKRKVKKVAAEDPLSSSGVSSLSGISSYNIRKISIYKNGDRFHRGVKFVINPRVIKDMEPLLNQINDRIELSHGAKKLYTTDGKVISSIKELEDGKIYVAASAQFIPMRYGEFAEKVWKPPSRKHSPIMSSDRIKTARTRSQDPGRRRQPQNSGVSSTTQGSAVQRSRSVKTLAEDRKSRRDNSHVARNNVNGSIPPPKKFDQPRPKAPPPKPAVPKQRRPLPASTTTTKKPPTPKRKISKKVLGAAAGVGVTVVGAAALGAVAAATKKGKPATPKPKPIPTGVSDVSTASSVIPTPNVSTSGAAEILEFPEEEKKIDVAMIHRTPTPPVIESRAPSARSLKKAPGTADRQPTPEASSEEDEGHEEDDEEVEDDGEEDGSEEVEEPSEEEEEDEEEEEEGEEEGEDEEEEEESRIGTPASRKSSSAVSSAGSHDEKKEEEEKK
uniref:Doublecortin domain-containing protein n=1 Tax=Caenorhabditis tropicalis TaxID=1561998 RepID=A0A1I7TPI7_9PELO